MDIAVTDELVARVADEPDPGDPSPYASGHMGEPAVSAAAGLAGAHQFVTANWPRLYRLAYFMTGNQQDAEDTVQTAMAVVVERWSSIVRRDDPSVYARRVVATTIYRRTRRRRIELTRLVDRQRTAMPSDPGDATRTTDLRDQLVAALAQLPPRMRAAIVMRHYGDFTEHETAVALGSSVGTVKSQTSRGLARLRLLLSTPTQEDQR